MLGRRSAARPQPQPHLQAFNAITTGTVDESATPIVAILNALCALMHLNITVML